MNPKTYALLEGGSVGNNDDQTIQLSIAISLRRIADVLQGDDQNSGIRHLIGDISDMMHRS